MTRSQHGFAAWAGPVPSVSSMAVAATSAAAKMASARAGVAAVVVRNID
jgi:hypothetical protein